jgi:hypothetical protein
MRNAGRAVFSVNHALSYPCGSIPSGEVPARFPLIAAEFPLIDAKTPEKGALRRPTIRVSNRKLL